MNKLTGYQTRPELTRHVHEPLDVGRGDVAHDPAQEQEVRGYETGICVGGPRVGLDDRQCQAQTRDAPPGDGDIRGVDLDEGTGHSGMVLRPALLEHAEDVVALAGARAEYPNGAGCSVQPVDNGSLDMP